MSQLIPVITMGGKEDPFPMVQNIWDFFSEKGIKVVFLSIGTSKTPLVELEFSEMLGCPVHIFDPNEEVVAKWQEVKEILQTRKSTETTSAFASSASKKWVLPRNLIVQNTLPFFYDGSVTVHEKKWNTQRVASCVKKACSSMNISDDQERVDVLKITMENEEASIIYAFLHAGFRPAFILVHWTECPDTSIQSMNAAGNLQMMGYALIGKEGSNFLYYFNDNNYYETCSWEGINKKSENPLINEIVKSVLPKSP